MRFISFVNCVCEVPYAFKGYVSAEVNAIGSRYSMSVLGSVIPQNYYHPPKQIDICADNVVTIL